MDIIGFLSAGAFGAIVAAVLNFLIQRGRLRFDENAAWRQELRHDNAVLTEKYERMQNQLHEYRMEKVADAEKISALDGQVKRLTAENVGLEKQMTEMAANMERVISENVGLKRTVETLNIKIKSIQTELDRYVAASSKDISTSPARLPG